MNATATAVTPGMRSPGAREQQSMWNEDATAQSSVGTARRRQLVTIPGFRPTASDREPQVLRHERDHEDDDRDGQARGRRRDAETPSTGAAGSAA
jgi:hypothetical protein